MHNQHNEELCPLGRFVIKTDTIRDEYDCLFDMEKIKEINSSKSFESAFVRRAKHFTKNIKIIDCGLGKYHLLYKGILLTKNTIPFDYLYNSLKGKGVLCQFSSQIADRTTILQTHD